MLQTVNVAYHNNHYSGEDMPPFTFNLQQGLTLQHSCSAESSSAGLTGNIWSWLKMTMLCTMHAAFPGPPHINQRATTSAPDWQCIR